MRKQVAISYLVQAIFFLAALAAYFNLAGADASALLKDQSTSMLGLLIFGVLLSIGVGVWLFGKADIRNDGKLLIVIGQATLSSFVLFKAAWVLAIVAVTFFFAFRFWRAG